MLKLAVIIASTRPGRVGLPVGTWAATHARRHGRFDVQLVDLKEVDLPLLDEAKHPRLRQYEHAHTKAWSALIDPMDAFLFVTPEYNYAAAPSLMNALDFLWHEWAYKPAAFVSYGGISGALRSVQMTKLVLTALNVMPLPGGVVLPFIAKQLVDGVFQPTPDNEKAADATLDELARWAEALKPMRAPSPKT